MLFNMKTGIKTVKVKGYLVTGVPFFRPVERYRGVKNSNPVLLLIFFRPIEKLGPVVELAYTILLKRIVERHAGSSPARTTIVDYKEVLTHVGINALSR